MSFTTRSLVAVAAISLSTAALGGAPQAAQGASAGTGDAAAVRRGPTIHSSDGIRGEVLSAVAPRARLSADGSPSHVRIDETDWKVAPGLDYSQWTEVAPQGPTRIFVLTAHLDEPGLVLDQVSGRTVSARAPLSQWIRADSAVAGVNADFFDISDTGAPLGVGVDRQRNLLHAPTSGWNTSFLLGRGYQPRIVTDRLVARLTPAGGKALSITTFNSPSVRKGGIGLYNSGWGRAPGMHALDGATEVRQVVVRGGIVRSNSSRLSDGTSLVGSHLLLGRGHGATLLRTRLKVGQRVSVKRSLSVPAHVAVSGSVQLLRGGEITTTDNRELHPRTAVGIDRDLHLIHLVVVDGRSENSGGHTLVQLAELLRSLGDEDGLNLDGGGSSTMLAADPAGVVAVRNTPSDGHERDVPNGLAFRYVPPKS